MKRITILLVFAVVVLALSACGGTSESRASAPELIRISVKANDSFEFDPGTITVPAGANVTISLENEGALEHSWTLVSNEIDPVEATDADAINEAASGNVAGGETARFSFVAPEPGEYQFVCTIPGHAAAGMVGTFMIVGDLKPFKKPRLFDLRITDDKHVIAIDLAMNKMSKAEINGILSETGALEVNDKNF